jgi:cytoskeletal protein CcmA (bactofilin family)
MVQQSRSELATRTSASERVASASGVGFPSGVLGGLQEPAGHSSLIGNGLIVKGDITGIASLFIMGKTKGHINLPDQCVTIGTDGEVAANVSAREIIVYGKVRGDLSASGRADIKVDSSVVGNVAGTLVSIESGAYFKGGVETKRDDDSSQNSTESGSCDSTRLVQEVNGKGTQSNFNQSIVGLGLCIDGEITGAADLVIEGKAQGSVNLPRNRVTIGRNGEVIANVIAREVVVLGMVRGNISASERADIRAEGSVTGDVAGARITIEDGALFKGRVDIRSSAQKLEVAPVATKARWDGPGSGKL